MLMKEEQYDDLRSHLFRKDRKERAAYVLFGVRGEGDAAEIYAHRVLKVEDEECDRQGQDYVRPTTEKVLRTLIEGANLGVSHGWERRFYHHVLNLYKNNYERYLSDNQKVRDRYVQMRLDYGNRVAGRQAEALASYQSALEVEGMSEHLREAVMKAINAIKGDE